MAEAKKTTKKETAKKPSKKVEKPAKEEVKGGVDKENIEAAVTPAQEPEEVNPPAGGSETKETAKAGKRSAKSLKEAEEKQAKEERKAESKTEETEKKPKPPQKPARSKLERRSKNYRKVHEQLEKGKVYALFDAIDLATKTSPVKFDATVEMHVRLGVDPRQADQNIRDTISLPSGSGKTVRVAVFAEADDVAKAKKAGADVAASDEFLQQLEKGEINFDVLISVPTNMAKLSKYAKLLGPKGLMPNPKSGTVTTNVEKAVTEAKAGRVEYRVDSTGIIHLGVGKVSFGKEKLLSNVQAVLGSIKANKPASVKGVYVKSIFVTTAMGPSIPVEPSLNY